MKNKSDRNDKIFDIILEEAFDKYADDIANQEIECEMTEEEIRTMENKEKTIYNKLMKEIDADRKSRISIKKICVLVAVLLLGVIVVSFSASAIYTWIQRTNLSMTGTDLNVNTEKLIFEDYNNIRNFENKSEIIIPNWLPEGMELTKTKDEPDTLDISYQKDDKWITICEKSQFKIENEKIDTENNLHTTETGEVLDFKCSIVKSTSETELTMISAYWNSNSTSYTLMTNVSEKEFYKILENLIYLED